MKKEEFIVKETSLVSVGWKRTHTPYINDDIVKFVDSVEVRISHAGHEKLAENIEAENEFINCFVHFNAGTEELDGIYLSIWNTDGTSDDAIDTARVLTDDEVRIIHDFALQEIRKERKQMEMDYEFAFPIGREVTVSVKYLYDTGITPLFVNLETEDEENGEIGYYDFKDDSGLTVCMDGETCTIYEVTKDRVKLLNKNGELETTFSLTFGEADICLFPNPLQEGFA